jgi:hypothetical protein
MNPVEQLNLTIWSWIEALRSVQRRVYFLPLLFYLGTEALLFALLWNFSHPAVSWFMAPLLKASFGPEALHYPANFLVFPALFGRLDIVLALVWGSLLFGTATYLFARGFGGEELHLGRAFSQAARCYPKLLLSQIPGTVLAVSVLYLAERHIAGGEALPGNTVRLFRYGGLLLAMVFQALFAFAMVLIVYEGAGLARALGESLRLAGRNAIGAVLLVGVPMMLHYPTSIILRRAPLLVARGAPEVLATVAGGDVLIGLVSNYLFLAGITRFYLASRRAG